MAADGSHVPPMDHLTVHVHSHDEAHKPPMGGGKQLQPEELNDMNQDKDLDKLRLLGGIQGLAHALHTDTHQGLSPDGNDTCSVDWHRQMYGANLLPERPRPSFLSMLLDAVKDPMIIVLLVVATVTIALGAAVPEQRAHNGWSEGLAVAVTALIVVFLGAGQDYSKELQFQKLNAFKDIIMVKVHRGGKQVVIPSTDVVVGDVLFLDTGDKVCADGVLIDHQGLVMDEASLTGESEPIEKDVQDDPWIRSGTTVNEGSGHVLVVAVGVNSEWGKTMTMVTEAGDDQTPLQEQLTDLAGKISKFGVLVAVICFLALFIKWLVENNGWNTSKINENGPLQFLLYAITITVVSIPEGLPLAVTLTLAYSMKRMMKDNSFVRVLAACETMGSATAICSDKTGTLTENRMTVVEGWFADQSYNEVPAADQLPAGLLKLLAENCSLNSKAFLVDEDSGQVGFVGNRTECALLMMLRKLGVEYARIREQRADSMVKLFGFSSARKMASVLLRQPHDAMLYRLYNKGAAEWVLQRCTAYVDSAGQLQTLTPSKMTELMNIVTSMAQRGLRCICLSYRYYPSSTPMDFFADADKVDNDLIAYAIVGIKDPVRKEVPAAVATCQKAGVVVRMVTGDNIHTAQHIARECGILTDDSIAMEGPTFRNMPASQLIPLLPRLRVLARSSPQDKLTLVSMLKQQGEVVAVTGDGTNDAPALKESDVGLAMGIAGTEVAKDAADIVILDDDFSSIVKSMLWGRCVFVNIRKFLVFQLSVNAVAMLSAAVGALYGGIPPLNMLQLLWVNMIMDTLAALALATENPYPELLDEPPHGRHEPLITPTMWVHILMGTLYKLFWILSIMFGVPRLLPAYSTLTKAEFYRETCLQLLPDQGYDAQTTATLCSAMGYCGFPEGVDTRQTRLCSLWPEWSAQNGTVPNDARTALCRTYPAGNDCPLYQSWQSAKDHLHDEYDREYRDSYKPALSLLFNAFIMAQLVNAFACRRIKWELNFFTGIRHSPIFLSIIGLTAVLQVIIMQTPISGIFKVQPLSGPEWAACIAIGLGVIPYSWAYRALVQFFNNRMGGATLLDILRGRRASARGRTLSGRTMSGRRSLSGRSNSGRAPSGNQVAPLEVVLQSKQ